MKKYLLTSSNIKIASIFYLTFLIINLIVLFATNALRPITKLYEFDNNAWGILRAFGGFDGFHYFHIAKEGYGQFQEAFFPLYPIIIKTSAVFTNTYFINGIIISNIAFFLLLYVIYVFFSELIGKEKTLWMLLFILVFPTSFFFGMLYTESLFLLLFLSALLSYKHKKYYLASVFGFLTALTRFVGIFTFIPLFIFILITKRKIEVKDVPALASPILGFSVYSVYLYLTTGDFLKFLHVLPQYGSNRSTQVILLPQVIYRYVKIFVTANVDFIYFIAATEFIIFGLFFIVLLWQLYYLLKKKYKFLSKENTAWLISLNLFSLINLLLPTLTGTLTSVPRYVLISISFFVALVFVENKIIKYTVVIVFVLFYILYLSFFYRNFFIG